MTEVNRHISRCAISRDFITTPIARALMTTPVVCSVLSALWLVAKIVKKGALSSGVVPDKIQIKKDEECIPVRWEK